MRPSALRACLLIAGAAVACGAPMPARAQDAAASADSLSPPVMEAAIRAWLGKLLGPTVQLPDRPVVVTREGDHDRIALDAAALSFGSLSADKPVATARIRPAGEKWQVDDIVTPSPLRLHLHAPGQPATGPAAGRADLATMTISMTEQAAHALIDPTGQGESLSQGSWRGIDEVIDSRSGHQTQHIDTLSAQSSLRPVADGRADVMQSMDGTGYSGVQVAPDGGELRMAAARFHMAGHLDGLDTARLGPALQALLLMSASATDATSGNKAGRAQGSKAAPAGKGAQSGTSPGMRMPDRAVVHGFLATLPGIVAGLQIEESADGVSVGLQGQAVSMAHLGLGMSADAPDGLLQARMDLALDGLSVPAVPHQFADLMPRHIALRPTVSGLDLPAVMALAEAATAEDPSGGNPGLSALGRRDLFGPNGLVGGIDSFSADIGPATLSGTGRVTMRRGGSVQGGGTITVSGFDALMREVGNTPELTQALPVFLLAKGLGRLEGERLVWDVTYENGRALVNGTDLSAMIPAGQDAPAASGGRRVSPAR